MQFQIEFSGHANIRSHHEKTIEITKEKSLTTKGDCIVGVNASCGCNNLPDSIKKKLMNSNSDVKISLRVGEHCFVINGKGHDNLTLTHPHDIVIRKSNFVCPRTLAVDCDKSSEDVPREIIHLLQNPNVNGIFEIEVI